MRKASGKRHKHGVTSAMVFIEVVRLYKLGRGKPVSRYTLVRTLPLEETTIDNRLRMLVKYGSLQVAGRGLYQPYQTPVTKGGRAVPASQRTPPFPDTPAPGYYFLSASDDSGLVEAIRMRQQPGCKRNS